MKVKGQGDPITKESVFKMTKERLDKEFPNNKFSEKDVRDVSMVWLLSGLRPRIMDEQIQKIRERMKPVEAKPRTKATGAEAEDPEEYGEERS